jgi:hypothetical protein
MGDWVVVVVVFLLVLHATIINEQSAEAKNIFFMFYFWDTKDEKKSLPLPYLFTFAI